MTSKTTSDLIGVVGAGFRKIDQEGDLVAFENDFQSVQPFPVYLAVRVRSCRALAREGRL